MTGLVCVSCTDVPHKDCYWEENISKARLCEPCYKVMMNGELKDRRRIERLLLKARPKPIKPLFWRRWLVYWAFALWTTMPKLSRIAWRWSRALATEGTQMKLAAYCSGIMMEKRMAGEYEDEPKTTVPSATERFRVEL